MCKLMEIITNKRTRPEKKTKGKKNKRKQKMITKKSQKAM